MFYTFTRSRHYRLFEANVEATGPSTPSAHRVRVDSSPASSSPLRLFHEILGTESAESRAHPDRTRDVWEISVWDPYPATLRIFCLFSPGHLIIHWLFLPLAPLDPRPSVTVFKCLVLQVLLSAQLLLVHSRFSQQAKDTAIIQKEVLHEYDTKYVHPRLHPVVREVGTQVSIGVDGLEEESVETGRPATLIRKGFQTYANPNYARLVDPDGVQAKPRNTMVSTMTNTMSNTMSPSAFTPAPRPRPVESSFSAQVSRAAGARQSLPSPSLRNLAGAAPSGLTQTSSTVLPQNPSAQGLGGSLGVFTHGNSPLKKATSMGDMNSAFSPRNSREMAALEQRETADRMIRQSSPLKENRRATTQFEANFGHSPGTLAAARANRWTQERFPSRRL